MIISHRRHLPEEILEKIIVQLPFKSIFRFLCVCKSWFNLIKNSPSICNHLKDCSDVQSFIPLCFIHKSKEELDEDSDWSLSLFLYHHDDVYGYGYEEGEASVTDRLKRLRKGIRRWLDVFCDCRKLDAKYPLPVLTFKLPSSNQQHCGKFNPSELELVGNCNGIMCFSHPEFILLVNPLLKEVKTLPKPVICEDDLVGFGFGFDNIKTMDFKLVRVIIHDDSPEAQVYNLKTNVWTKLAFPFRYPFRLRFKRSTFLNGVIHWCLERNFAGVWFPWKMLTFNLATELFELIAFPSHWDHGLHGRCKVRPPVGLFVLNHDSLAFVTYAGTRVGVWTMNKGKETTTWTERYSIISWSQPLQKPIAFWMKDKLLYETKSGCLLLYDIRTHRLTLLFDPLQVSQHCFMVEAAVLCGSSLVSMNM